MVCVFCCHLSLGFVFLFRFVFSMDVCCVFWFVLTMDVCWSVSVCHVSSMKFMLVVVIFCVFFPSSFLNKASIT